MRIVRRNTNSPASSGISYSPIRGVLDDFFRAPSLLEDFFGRSMSVGELFADVWEEGEKIMVKMAMPGLSKEDIEINITGDVVNVKGHSKKEEKEDTDKKYYLKSMEASFEQTFNLPCVVNAEAADAEYKDGVLTITLPKAEQSKSKQLKIS